MKSTLSCTSQWKTLMKVKTVNMATNPTLNSSRKIVMARQVSMTAWLIRSLMRSTSVSLNWPRKTCEHPQCLHALLFSNQKLSVVAPHLVCLLLLSQTLALDDTCCLLL